MNDLIEDLQRFEKRNNFSAAIILYSDGSNEVKDFWASDETIAMFDSLYNLHKYLKIACYKKDKDSGLMIAPAKLICSVCKSENPCSGVNNIEPCFLIQEQKDFLITE